MKVAWRKPWNWGTNLALRGNSISWVDQCPSENKDQHMPGGARDASSQTTEESEGEAQPTQLASL